MRNSHTKNTINEKSAQTLLAVVNKAEPKKFAPPHTPFPGARDSQNLISWRLSLPLPIQTQFGEDRCTQFRIIMVTDCPPAHYTPTDRTDYNTLRRTAASTQCKNLVILSLTHYGNIAYTVIVFVQNVRYFASTQARSHATLVNQSTPQTYK